MSLRSKSVKGIAWSAIGRIVQQVLGLFLTAIFTHLLSPADFGLLRMIMVFQGFVGIFRTLGLNTAVIQRKDLNEGQLSAVFIVNIATGVALSGILFAGAPIISAYFHESLTNLTRWTCLAFILSSVTIINEALLVKRLQFYRVVAAEFLSFVVAGVIGAVAAFHGMGVYALVINVLAGFFFSSLFMFFACPWTPRAKPDWKGARELLFTGGKVTGVSILTYIHRNFDAFLIGRYLGKNPLGYYNLSYRVMRVPTQQISGVVSTVALPAFSEIQEDTARMGRGFLKISHYIALILFPALVGLIITAPEAICLAFGDKWRPAVFVIQVLTISGILQCIQSPMSILFVAGGRAGLLLIYQAFSTLCYVAVFMFALKWGIEGVAIGYTAITLLLSPALHYLVFGMVSIKWRDYFAALKDPTVATLTMAMAVFMCRTYGVLWAMPRWVTLAASVSTGVAVYLLALWAMNPRIYGEVLDLIRTSTRREKPSAPAPAAAIAAEK